MESLLGTDVGDNDFHLPHESTNVIVSLREMSADVILWRIATSGHRMAAMLGQSGLMSLQPVDIERHTVMTLITCRGR